MNVHNQPVDTTPVRRDNPGGRYNKPMEKTDLVSLKEAADKLKCSVSTIYKAVKHKDLPHFRIGSYYFVRMADAQAWFDKPKNPKGRPRKTDT